MDTPTGLGAPFCVRGRIMPTRTGPEPSVSPTVGPATPAPGATGGTTCATGVSNGVELQPASDRASPAPITDRRVSSGAAGDTDTGFILTSRGLPGKTEDYPRFSGVLLARRFEALASRRLST